MVDNGSAELPAGSAPLSAVGCSRSRYPDPVPPATAAWARPEATSSPSPTPTAAPIRAGSSRSSGASSRIRHRDHRRRRLHRAGGPGRMTVIEAYESIYAYRTRLYIERDRYIATRNMAVRADLRRGRPLRRHRDRRGHGLGQRATALGRHAPRADDAGAHPARRDFAELGRKWDRHIAHFYDETAPPAARRPRWMARTGVSRLAARGDPHHPLRSDRVGARDRRRALEVPPGSGFTAPGDAHPRPRADPARLSGAWNRG